VLATVPDLDPAGIIGLRGNGITTSKIDDFLSELSKHVHEYWSENLAFGISNMQLGMVHLSVFSDFQYHENSASNWVKTSFLGPKWHLFQ